MRIRFIPREPENATPVIISRGDAESPAGLHHTAVRQIQVGEYVRSDVVDIFDRQNRKDEITFRVTRLHANAEAAELFVVTHPDELASDGTLIMESSTMSRSMSGAVISRVECYHLGATSHSEYNIVGPGFSQPVPVIV